MRTLTTEFAKFKDREGAQRNFILSLTDGSTTWHFSRWPIDLTDGECYPILSAGFNTTEGSNIYTKAWKAPKITLTIANKPYIRDDGAATFSRPSDILSGIRYQEAKVYLAVGETNTLADMEVGFAGLVADEPESSTATMRVVINDYARQRDIDLPFNTMVPTFNQTPQSFTGNYIPIAYGKYNFSWDYWSGDGLAIAIPTNAQLRAFVISDHKLDAFTALHAIENNLSDPAEFDSATKNVDDSGRGTATSVGRKAQVLIFPSTEDELGDYTDVPPAIQEFYNIPDRSISSANVLTNNFEEGDNFLNIDPEGMVMMAFPDQGFLHTIASDGGEHKFNYKAIKSAQAPSLKAAEIRLYYDNTPDDIYHYESMVLDNTVQDSATWLEVPEFHPHISTPAFDGTGVDDLSVIGEFTLETQVSYLVRITSVGSPNRFRWSDSLGGGASNVDCTTIGSPVSLSNGISIYFSSTTGHTVNDAWTFEGFAEPHNTSYALAVWVQGDEQFVATPPIEMDLLVLYEMRINVRFPVRKPKSWWATCDGYPFESWATTRSTNYSAGDTIEDPVQISHSVLRDILSLTDTEIDHASLDACENTSVVARLNLHSDNRLSVYRILRQLAEQGTYCFYWGCNGMARAFTLNDKSPTIDRTFTWEDMSPDSLHVTKAGRVINYLTVRSKFQQEYDRFRDTDIVQDGTSQSAYGTFKFNAKWPNLSGTSSDHVAALFVNTTDGIWSKEHYQITFESLGWKDYDLQPGNYVAMDNTSVGAHLSCKGNTWTDRDFMITEVNIRNDRIKFTAIELFE